VIAQILLLLFIVVRYQAALSNGVPVLLKVVPVDPRDLLRGDYVTLRYEISTIELALVKNTPTEYSNGDTVYVKLEKGEKFWNATAVDKKFHPTSASEIWLRGTKEYSWQEGFKVINLKFGIEQFFVPEGKGKIIEQARNAKNLSIEIRVTEKGIGLIKQVYANNQPVELNPVK